MWLTRGTRWLLASALAVGFLALPATAGAAPTPEAENPPASQEPASYLVADATTGRVVAAKNEHAPHLTASTIKVLTALVALEHLPLSTRLQVSALAARQPASKIDMKQGSEWPLEQALASLMIISANDAAYAMAENTGGDLAGFAKLATETSARLGLQETAFADPAGLDGPEGFGGGTRSSAYDLAVIARNAISIPAIAETAGKTTFEFTDPSGVGRRLVNHNRGMLTGYPGATGLKTGFTKAASRTLIATATRDGRTCIATVMNTWDDSGWASRLLDQCFAAPAPTKTEQLPPVRVVTADDRLTAAAAVPRTLGARRDGLARRRCRDCLLRRRDRRRKPGTPHDRGTRAAPGGRGHGSRRTGRAGTRPRGRNERRWRRHVVVPRRAADRGYRAPDPRLGRGPAASASSAAPARARRLARAEALAEARRRGMIDVIDTDEGEIRLMPTRTSHHVAASSRRHSGERRVVRPARPRDHSRRSSP